MPNPNGDQILPYVSTLHPGTGFPKTVNDLFETAHIYMILNCKNVRNMPEAVCRTQICDSYSHIFPELGEPAASYLLFTLFIVQWGMFG